MYVWIHQSVLATRWDDDENAQHALENLLASAFEGNHFIDGDLETLRSLARLPHLSRRSTAILNKTANWKPQMEGITARVTRILEVTGDAVTSCKPGDRVWKIPLGEFKKVSMAARTLLLGENLIDCDLYKKAAEQYRCLEGLSALAVVLDTDGAGGSTIVDRYRRLMYERSRITACVVDSDRFSHHEPRLKGTAEACWRISEEANWPTVFVCLESRELENAIPRRFIDEAIQNAPRDRWEQVKRSFGDNLLIRFADLKNGVSIHWVLRQKGFVGGRDWIAVLKKSPGLRGQAAECMKFQECVDGKKSDEICPECVAIPPVCHDVARRVLDWAEGRTVQKAVEVLDNTEDKEWLEIGRQVFWACCARSPQRI
jgi:hypothetical protein